MCMCVKLHQLCPTPCDPLDCSPRGSSVHGNSLGQNTIVSCHALPPGDCPNPVIKHKSCVSCIAGIVYPPGKPLNVYTHIRIVFKCKSVLFKDLCSLNSEGIVYHNLIFQSLLKCFVTLHMTKFGSL